MLCHVILCDAEGKQSRLAYRMGIIEGSSRRMMVGTYSALGTLDDISWNIKQHKRSKWWVFKIFIWIFYGCTLLQTIILGGMKSSPSHASLSISLSSSQSRSSHPPSSGVQQVVCNSPPAMSHNTRAQQWTKRIKETRKEWEAVKGERECRSPFKLKGTVHTKMFTQKLF